MDKQKFFFIYIMPVLLVGLLLGLILVAMEPSRPRVSSDNEELVLHVLDLINDHYVERISRKNLSRRAIQGMVRDLDRYSDFLDVQEARAAEEDNQGRFGGLGVHIGTEASKKNHVLTITRPFRKGPAKDAGILPGDRIVAVDGDRLPPIRGNRDLARVIARVKGKVGTSVRLTIQRDEDGKTVELDRTLTRCEVQVESVVASRMVNPERGIGYFRITSFKDRTVEEMNRELDAFLSQGLKGLIMDLRSNGGGLLRRSAEVVDQFLIKGLIVSTRGRNSEENEDLYATRAARVPSHIPVVVLINGHSASASEAVAGALQDHHRAVLLGERSYGKGVVQTVYKLSRTATSLKITTSRYYTPSGRCIDRIYTRDRKRFVGGILPDVVVVLDNKEEDRIMGEGGEWDRWLADQVDPRTPAPPPIYNDTADRQLLAAMNLLAGKFQTGHTVKREGGKGGR